MNSIDIEKADDDIIDLQNALAGNHAEKTIKLNLCLKMFEDA